MPDLSCMVRLLLATTESNLFVTFLISIMSVLLFVGYFTDDLYQLVEGIA